MLSDEKSATVYSTRKYTKQRLKPLMRSWEYEFFRTRAAIRIIMAMQRQCTHTHTGSLWKFLSSLSRDRARRLWLPERVSRGAQDRKGRGRTRDKDGERDGERCGEKLERETAGNWVRPSVITNSGHCWTPLLPRRPPPHPRRPQQGLKQKTE